MDTVASHGKCFCNVSLGQSSLTTSLQKRHVPGRKRVLLRRHLLRHHTVRICSQAGFGRGAVKIKEEEEEGENIETEPSSGTKKLFKLPFPSKSPGTVKLQNKSQSQAKSNKIVFVAGATGKVGSRTVRELLKLGYSVRASTRNAERAQALFEDVASSAAGASESDNAALFGFFSPAKFFGFLKPKEGKKLEIVECNLENPESIEPALGNAGIVVCCIGASEKEVLDVTGPYRIDFKATENLINAASSAEVNHFVLLTSLGTQKFGFPAAVLNLFWGVLLWKAKAEKALLQSGLPYTIVRPGGMERPTDAYKETHNLILAEADKLYGGQVSNLQVAELLASIVENPDVSVNKIVEAIAETTAPLRPIKELLEEISAKEISSAEFRSLKTTKPAKADIDVKEQGEEKFARKNRAAVLREREEKQIQVEKLAEEKRAQSQKEKEEKRIQAEQEEKEKQRLQALRKKYEEEIEAAREKQEAAKSAAAAALTEKAELEKRAAEIQAKAEAAVLAASQAKAVEAAVLAAARKGIVISYDEKEKIIESVRLARLPKKAALEEQSKPSLKKKPAFSLLGRTAPSFTTTETTTETEPAKEVAEEKDAEAISKVKADKKTIADKKQKEDRSKKEQDSKKLAEAKKKEEQVRLEKEAKELKEAEAKRKEEELAKAKKKEEEEKKKKEVEAKKKEEEETAKKEAEAKRKEELAEAKKKEEEEKTKKEVEAKKKEEEEIAKKEAEAKVKEKELAEAKKKEEELAEAKKEEEEKAKKEAEMLQAQEEEKAKALAEEEAAKLAAISAAADEKADEKPMDAESLAPRRKGFRWFWEPAEPETPDVEESAKEEVTDVPVEAQIADQLPPCPTPLSPYARYPGLKPPAPPIASPTARKPEKVAPLKVDPVSSEINGVDQASEKAELPSQEEPDTITKAPSEDSQDDIEERAQKIEEIAAREREALEKAQAAISFKWPWQSSETTVEESTSALKEEEPVVSQEAVSPTTPSQEKTETTPSQDKTETLPPSSRPLSPYAQFPNLKPPSPPKASAAPQNSSAANTKPAETLASSSSKLSPYPGFPELKPPTSPAPGGNGAMPAQEAKEEEKAREPAAEFGFKWPWQQ